MEALLLIIIEQVGIPLLLKLIASKSPEEVTSSLLAAEYATMRAAVDEQARKDAGL